ncbi:amidohydrolase family protein [Castellaniella caeni]|uniref:amidohydrolase family protein n=1 Tax=Castellaniella caeni TaxID=266123 RepID=UPI0008341C85|nr:amidohydrolase family protein [Castellaniella caeni]
MQAELGVDAHLHFWRYVPAKYPWIGPEMSALGRDCLPEQAWPLLSANGVQAGVAVQARASEAENDWLLGLAHRHPWIRAVVGWLDLSSPSAPQRLERWAADPLFRGCRPMLQDEPDPAALLASPVFNQGVRAVQDAGRVFELLVRAHQFSGLYAFCRAHDAQPMILDHIGKPAIDGKVHAPAFVQWRRQVEHLASLPHVSVKLSGLVTEVSAQVAGQAATDAALFWPYLDVVLEAFGADRILFGSDWPVCTVARPYAQVLALVRAWSQARLSHDELRGFRGVNAARIYQLV